MDQWNAETSIVLMLAAFSGVDVLRRLGARLFKQKLSEEESQAIWEKIG